MGNPGYPCQTAWGGEALSVLHLPLSTALWIILQVLVHRRSSFHNVSGWVVLPSTSGTEMCSHLSEQNFRGVQPSAGPDLITPILLVISLRQATNLTISFAGLYLLIVYYGLIWFSQRRDRVFDSCHLGWKILSHVPDKWKSIFHVQN